MRAVVRPVEAPLDLLSVAGDTGVAFERDGAGVAGRGVALTLDLRGGLDDAAAVAAVGHALRGIEVDGPPGAPGPVAIGALPFTRTAAASLVVPALTVRRDADGHTWAVAVGDDPKAPAPDELAPPRPRAEAPDGFTLTSCRPHAEWRTLVDAAVADIRRGDMTKVVLAREVIVDANRPIPVEEVVRRLRSLYPSCFVFSVDGFVGATPELLVARHGRDLRSHPMAGTLPRSGDPETDRRTAERLLSSDKDRREHQAVIDDIAGALRPVCDALDLPDGPSIVSLRNVVHLGTAITGTLSARGDGTVASSLELAARLHPTPAVCGTPTAAAAAWLARAEGFDRRRYAGPVGWVDSDGDGMWAVGVRSAEVDGSQARLYAGVGVVDGSDADDELAETQFKLQALLAALVRP